MHLIEPYCYVLAVSYCYALLRRFRPHPTSVSFSHHLLFFSLCTQLLVIHADGTLQHQTAVQGANALSSLFCLAITLSTLSILVCTFVCILWTQAYPDKVVEWFLNETFAAKKSYPLNQSQAIFLSISLNVTIESTLNNTRI